MKRGIWPILNLLYIAMFDWIEMYVIEVIFKNQFDSGSYAPKIWAATIELEMSDICSCRHW